jgi:chemotaxis signal transduction protein
MTTKLDTLLVQRAAALAQPLVATDDGSGQSLICFTCGSLLLGVSHGELRTIVHAPRMVCVAGLPHGIVGISTFKGELASVLDFGLWSGLGPTSSGRLLIVAQNRGRTLALRADELVDVGSRALCSPGESGQSSARVAPCVLRVTQELVSILDLPSLFDALASSRPERSVP